MSSMPAPLAQAFNICLDAQNKLIKPNKQLDNAVSNARKNGLPEIAIAPAQGEHLAILCQMIGAKAVLEIGTLGAYSTIWFANSVPGIHVTSIEFNPKHKEVAQQNVKGFDNVEILLGSALDVLPKLAEQGKIFDFVFIDADWDEQSQYFDWAVKLTRKGGAVYVDNAVRPMTEAEEGDPTGGSALIDSVKGDARVNATLIPTLNTHKRTLDEIVDGYLLAFVK